MNRSDVSPSRTRVALRWAAALALMVVGGEPARSAGPAPAAKASADLSGLELGTDWINVGGPIHARDLRGKVVLLDFWTLCCINCHHILPDLEKLEEKYKDQLVVIGVHTPKFPAERELEIVRAKVNEYRVKHPVVSDADQAIWNRYGVHSWPSLLVFGPDGKLVDQYRGELGGCVRENLDRYIGQLIAEARAKGSLNEAPFRFLPESEKPRGGALHYPGKVVADGPGKRLFLSDTGNNRVVMTDLEGKGAVTIGSGVPGLADGDFAGATFNRPQGLFLHEGTLYVADTENHAIRAIDLRARRVKTIAGNGTQGPWRPGHFVARASATPLNSPWDLLIPPGGKGLFIAMAGPHQIWRLELAAGTIGPWAGTGDENILDGDLTHAQFAQPSGLATDGKRLFVADSETSSLRSIALAPGAPGKPVETIVGNGLFVFGDVDGKGKDVRLQHCLGLAFGGGKLFVADSYNNKIKECKPETHEVKALVGPETGETGSGDLPRRFNQPGGLSLAGSTLYVADTNNHAIRAVDLSANPPVVHTLSFEGLAAPRPPRAVPRFLNATKLSAPAARALPGSKLVLDVRLTLPPDFKLNPEAPLTYLVEVPGKPAAPATPVVGKINPPVKGFEVEVPLAAPAKAGEALELKFSLSTFQCREGSEGICLVKSYLWTVPVTFADGAPVRVSVSNAAAAATAAAAAAK